MVPFALFTLAAVVVGTIALPLNGTSDLLRRAATVYSSCTTPNTVALTFVRLITAIRVERRTDVFCFFVSQDDGPYIYLYAIPLFRI
jgi:hypothetical protein